MGRSSRPVLKYDKDGQIIETWESVNKAAAAEGIQGSSLRNLMHYGKTRFGCKYKLGRREGKQIVVEPDRDMGGDGEQPWEVNGFFSIVGWSKICL